ncbi:MAG: porin [Leptospira sp.]|nr:porin [Leptospira sp.]
MYLVLPCISLAQSKSNKFVELTDKIKESESQKWYNTINVSGYVDVYYNYTLNNKQGSQDDTSETFHRYNKQWAVNAVKLSIDKIAEKESRWGFRLDSQNGQSIAYQERPGSTTNNIFNMNLLQQGYVSMYFPVLRGLKVDAGKMYGHIGFDSLNSIEMVSYTLGYIFYNVPFINTGARAALQVSENWTLNFFFYNSAQGTGYLNPATANTPPVDKLDANSAFSNTNHAYSDGLNIANSKGTRLNGDLIKDRLSLTWNTLFGDDNGWGRIPNRDIIANDISGSNYLRYPGTKSRNDYYFINEIWVTMNPTEKFTMTFDWIYQIRSGNTAAGNGAYVSEGTKKIGNYNFPLTIGRDDNDVKRINTSYGIWAKYTFIYFFALGFRYENFDDSRYGGSYVANPPLSQITPLTRYDLQFLDSTGLRKPSNLGQTRSLTITPTFTYTEHVVIKLDIRRDWALGSQFVDTQGRPSHQQYGFILGLVAKF